MAFAYDRLTEITTIAATVGAVFTNPASQTTYIRHMIVHNGNTTDEQVLIYVVPDNAGAVGTAGTTNETFKPMSDNNTKLATGDTWEWWAPANSPGIILEDENDTIQADAETASKVTIQIYGGKE
ncbi:MAG: hypothetical protein SVY53_09265 [Chloroflexota bacterium]|nr:hypothetical protein [Chloroflexota bacterium]